jgi:hypothetical protein
MNQQKFPCLTQLLACIAVACAISVRYAPAPAQTPKPANAPALTIVLTRKAPHAVIAGWKSKLEQGTGMNVMPASAF